MKIFLIVSVIVLSLYFVIQVKGQNTDMPVGSVLVYDHQSVLYKNKDGSYSTRVPITICNVKWGIDMCDRFITDIKFDYGYRNLR